MTEDIYRIKNELLQMVYDHDWGGYQKGVKAESERIVKLLEVAKLKTGWDLEAEIDQLIQELKGQTK
jgi:hypothetical protein